MTRITPLLLLHHSLAVHYNLGELAFCEVIRAILCRESAVSHSPR